jgi:inosine/xanthosine triphosphatase
MLVAVGTQNPAKVEGVRRAFSKFFPGVEVRATGAWRSGNPQPLGLRQITSGAISRARLAMKSVGGDFGVGVEAGIFRLHGLYLDHQQAVIMDRMGRMSLGHSSGFMLPNRAVEDLLESGRELEEYATRLTGISRVGDKGGIIHFLSKGAISRADLTEQCVVSALIPWLHRRLYRL